MITLNPDERLLIESRVNRYKLVGPGLIWVKPWQRVLTRLYVGPQGQPLQFEKVRTIENIPVNIILQLLHRVDPNLCNANLLPRIPELNDGRAWSKIICWRTEHVLRQLVASNEWRDLGQKPAQKRLERLLTQKLAEYLKVVGLRVDAVLLVRLELPVELQQTIVQAEQDSIEPRGRAQVLKEYFDIFGHDLGRAMPFIAQWELLNAVNKNGNSHCLVTNSPLPFQGESPNIESTRPVFQMQLPLTQDS